MNPRRAPHRCLLRLSVLLLAPVLAAGQAPPGGGANVDDRVAALKQSLAQSAQRLRTYQWVETTTVTMKGEVKSQKQMSCYYGADGALQKIPIAATPPPKQKGGIRGAIQKSKTEEIKGEMKQAVDLVHQYVPPEPARLQHCREAGKISLEILQPGKVVRIVCRDYLLVGDALAITMDVAANRLTALDVSTYLNQPASPVTLSTRFGALNDGTSYTANTTLGLQAQQISVTVANSGYRPL